MTFRLYDLAGADPDRRFSPYCWRTRLALAHKELPVETVPWRVERQIQTEHHARMHVQNECKPRATNAGAGDIINQHDVDLGVVDLDDLKRPIGT